jgi:hypothetical protein
MSATLHYSRYGGQYTSKHATVHEAARAAVDGQEQDSIFATKIEIDGAVVWERTAAPPSAEAETDLQRLEALASNDRTLR